MNKLTNNEKAFIKYGLPSDLITKLLSCNLTVTTVRATSIVNLKNKYNLNQTEAELTKLAVTRKPIDDEVLDSLLLNNNFTCCCCLGQKGHSIIIHHINEYEISQDNSYNNLAVLCPVCHDLAHSTRALTLTISKNQLIEAKRTWEVISTNKRKRIEIQPTIKSWQAEFEIHEDGMDFKYLLDLTVVTNANETYGRFNLIYLDRGNTFIAGEYSHPSEGIDFDVEVKYWEMQWGIRVSEKRDGKIILNYGFADSIYWISQTDIFDGPKTLELKLETGIE